MFSYLPCTKGEEATKAVGEISTTMLFGVGFNNGVNYDPFNPLGKHDENKDRKAANRIAGLVTKVRNEAMFRPW
ncbi:hypothetical protein GUITHDRAFT_121737 [Guillardia theta CCMP2712]|uniref:Uncharacterized protein n=1 Tax=Guillardia theta (strain CCMP2712) TaxID=905079 RepID=L1I8A3_GUITC|nr:hypothetical protein GUITHDRAFT_121737 [Guillardia theta CCMP2712]EKX32085.1 hypothetical protein GUITHDRAFT_121737 [Guillardia theta CCMP2712]|eukprot:XP_005819065.1 hypothetical protein GUITHDRAFT_121737 [Guillardia theta CCMP2712]